MVVLILLLSSLLISILVLLLLLLLLLLVLVEITISRNTSSSIDKASTIRFSDKAVSDHIFNLNNNSANIKYDSNKYG